MVLENQLEVVKSGGYAYAALKTEDGFDLYCTFDSWDGIPLVVGVTANPAAGASPATVTVPSGKRWLYLGGVVSLVADATVASRYVYNVVYPNGTTQYLKGRSAAVTASQTRVCHFVPGVTNSSVIGNDEMVAIGGFLPTELPAGATITVESVNLQVGDDYGAFTYFYKEAPA